MALNKVIMNGRLCADPELKKTQSGLSVTSLNIAVSKGKEETDFFKITAWRNTAEFICKYFKKGDGICIDGHLATNTYEKNGEKRTSYEIVCDSVDFPVGRGKGDEGQNASPTANEAQKGYNPYQPSFENVKDDSDLPF